MFPTPSGWSSAFLDALLADATSETLERDARELDADPTLLGVAMLLRDRAEEVRGEAGRRALA